MRESQSQRRFSKPKTDGRRKVIKGNLGLVVWIPCGNLNDNRVRPQNASVLPRQAFVRNYGNARQNVFIPIRSGNVCNAVCVNRSPGWKNGNQAPLADEATTPAYKSLGDMANVMIGQLIATASEHRRGFGGLFHLINHAAALTELTARGVRLIDETPRPGAEGARVAFIHPASAHGVLVELKEEASGQSDG